MELDDILLKYIGEIGPYQILMVLYISAVGIHSAFNAIEYTFIGAVPEFYCDVGNISHLSTSSLSFSQLKRLTSPVKDNGEINSCSMYVRNYSALSLEEAYELIGGKKNYTDSIVPCSKWIFSEEQYRTVASEWSLVCDNEWLIATSQSVYMAGMFTVILGGLFADRFGRRTLALSVFALNAVARACSALSINYTMFIASRFFMAVATVNWYTAVFVIAIEMVTPKYRVIASQVPYYFWSIGYMILAGMAYFIRDWRILTGSLLVFMLPFVFHICILPESIRWLQAKHKIAEANKIIVRMAKANRKTLPEDVTISNKDKEKQQEAGILDLFKSAKLIRITLILMFDWLTVNFVYYGLIFYLPKLGGNIYISTVISGALEIPALLYVQLSLDRLGWRINIAGSYLISGVALLALMGIPADLNWLIMMLALIGRFAITVSFAAIYLYTSECFPTLYRSAALTLCSGVSRIGGIISPYIALSGNASAYLPLVFFGSVAIAAGLLTLLLPETNGVPLPKSFTNVVKPVNSPKADAVKEEEEGEKRVL